ncbi:hypothetical protein evm_010298 [Chilo suppressalis]|nr:hypothetical protein evm_010298 [Chilo suppressalis]
MILPTLTLIMVIATVSCFGELQNKALASSLPNLSVTLDHAKSRFQSRIQSLLKRYNNHDDSSNSTKKLNEAAADIKRSDRKECDGYPPVVVQPVIIKIFRYPKDYTNTKKENNKTKGSQ